jgi:hypothetical protein
MQVEFANEDDETNLYRGDPFWTSNHTSSFKVVEEGENAHNDNPWHDFVYVKWRTTNNSSSTYETIIPARILFFSKFQMDAMERTWTKLFTHRVPMHWSSLV